METLTPFCKDYQRAVQLLGRRWTGEIVRALLSGRTRFSELVAVVPRLSDRLLSARLKELEAEGVVARRVTPETPVRIEYVLTEKGLALGSVVNEISLWAEKWMSDDAAAEESIS